MTYILPLILTLGGEIQNILLFFNLATANATPEAIVAGRAGGTVIVNKSSDFAISYCADSPFLIIIGRVARKPNTATKANKPTKISESL